MRLHELRSDALQCSLRGAVRASILADARSTAQTQVKLRLFFPSRAVQQMCCALRNPRLAQDYACSSNVRERCWLDYDRGMQFVLPGMHFRKEMAAGRATDVLRVAQPETRAGLRLLE